MTPPAEPPGPNWPEHLRPGRPVEVAPGVTRIIAPNPGYMSGPGTNTYILGSDRMTLIDPGPDDDAHLGAVMDTVGDRLRWILATHTHIDHTPLAVRLKELTGAQLLGFGPPLADMVRPDGIDPNDASFTPDRLLADGDRLDAGELTLEAVHTPGHASNHLCFILAGTGLLFSGDHVMSGSTVVIAPPDGDMALYLRSLEKVRALAPRRIAPGHGDVIEDPAAVLDGYLQHRHEREAQIIAALRSAPPDGATPEELVAAIYTDVPAVLHPVARYSVWAHLRKLATEGRATSPNPDDISSRWSGLEPLG
jgi:glyoxylase-like metal-dependent hydrolase (beta-lactamase superfamily II)